MTAVRAHRVDAGLRPDPSRVLTRLFAPGGSATPGRSRLQAIADRVMAIDEPEVDRLAARVIVEFAGRGHDLAGAVRANAALVAGQVGGGAPLSAARTVLLGAALTAEYATEAAALCNPSAVAHPDQDGLLPGQLRVAVSLRAIGEGHISSIAFVDAIVGPGPRWTFGPRRRPVVSGRTAEAIWSRARLRTSLAEHDGVDAVTAAVLGALPDLFTDQDFEHTLAGIPARLRTQPGAPATIDLIRRTLVSAYSIEFPTDSDLSQRLLFPHAAQESNGMEDARLTRFTDDDRRVEYRATYTAYDGRDIAPRLLTSPDLRRLAAGPLVGPAATNKGMALFPRRVGGEHLALCRTDGETISLARSADGFRWSSPVTAHAPVEPWEVIQVGNCGPPIETGPGWLVLTHGVGPMRTYVMGAILLDLDDPTRVIGRLREPLLRPDADERDGYVPNVVYSCGGIVHDGRLWIPYGIGDARIGVAWVDLAGLLAALTGDGQPDEPESNRS
ncbi:glycosylase [Nakamurella flava]|uniref:Glycosylase n=1 Tax=Nakamurella flava TaxID=2576308 RepID=A0A4U6QLB3_9ACTN|nr:glycoside hydrolase family 130 protein [Nakamurella flava]TKV60908.1 glycosylase [Nakamurella flava]